MTNKMASSTSYLYSPTEKSVDQALHLLNSVYGPANSPDFPRSMRSSEAGPCHCQAQHRYLWTDAFAVLAYQTLSEYYSTQENNDKEAKVYQRAVGKLISVVHDCLGKPRSEREEDQMTPCDVSPTGYVGLRIGKEESRKVTDYGMSYDGQYFHYVDKWLFALARTNHVEEGIRIAKSCFPYFFSSGRHGGGIRWKLSVDASAPPSLQNVHGPNDDTLNALIVYSMLEKQNQSNNKSSYASKKKLNLQDEIEFLQSSLQNYRPHATNDPLGWGLEALFDQFIIGHPRTEKLRKLAPEALHSMHLGLPFRLYGALIGALVVPSSAVGGGKARVSPEYLQELLELCVTYQFEEMTKESGSRYGYEEKHSSINRVMLATALLGPGALRRRDSDPIVQI